MELFNVVIISGLVVGVYFVAVVWILGSFQRGLLLVFLGRRFFVNVGVVNSGIGFWRMSFVVVVCVFGVYTRGVKELGADCFSVLHR